MARTHREIRETLERYSEAIAGRLQVTPENLRGILEDAHADFSEAVERVRRYADLALKPECIRACQAVFGTEWSPYWEYTLWSLSKRAWNDQIDHTDPVIDRLSVDHLRLIFGLAQDAGSWLVCTGGTGQENVGDAKCLRLVKIEEWLTIYAEYRARSQTVML